MRIIDIAGSLLLILIFLPIFLPIIILLRVTGEGEIFYAQSRVGQHNKDFNIYKFATMLKNSPNMGAGTITTKNDPRVLPVGRFLRKSKINELPQLFNIFIGDMSFIGPRPHARRDLQGINKKQLDIITSVRPGLSGVASILFRNEEHIIHDQDDPRVFYDEHIAPYKASLEVWFVDNYSLKLYFKLMMLTMLVVLGIRPLILMDYIGDIPKLPRSIAAYFGD